MSAVAEYRGAGELLHDRGLMIVDDYQNPNYPQVPAAVHTYLANPTARLSAFMLGSNKAYLCSRRAAGEMLAFAMRELQPMMDRFGVPIVLSKTDKNARYDVVGFYPRKGGMAPIYGEHLYGHYFAGK